MNGAGAEIARADDAPAYLTGDQVGAMLQLSAKSIYRLAAADPTLPILKVGGSTRFPRERLGLHAHERREAKLPTPGATASVAELRRRQAAAEQAIARKDADHTAHCLRRLRARYRRPGQ